MSDEIQPIEIPPVSVESTPRVSIPVEPIVPPVASPSVETVIPSPQTASPSVPTLPTQTPPHEPPASQSPQGSDGQAGSTVSTSSTAIWDWHAMLIKAREAIQFRKKARLEKIMKLAQDKHSITNDQVQLMLRVSDSTAQSYINMLIKTNRLKATGSGPSRRYEPVI